MRSMILKSAAATVVAATLAAGSAVAAPVEIRFDNPAGGGYSPVSNPGPVFSQGGVSVTAACGTSAFSCTLTQDAEGLGVASTTRVSTPFGTFFLPDTSGDIDGFGSDEFITLTLNGNYRLLRVDFELVSSGDESVLLADGLPIGFGNILGGLGIVNAAVSCGAGVDDGALGQECEVSLAALNVSGSIFRIGDGPTGGTSLDITDNYRIESIVIEQIPEPMSLALFGSALIGLGFARRRR